ncbi:Crt-like 1 [Durusdinium trenchii]|uniref:Crt-like 1 n=1 Tax=Durusdinium trenchii TaxID=1381693 RepID=A0ABP0HJM5_9DINO
MAPFWLLASLLGSQAARIEHVANLTSACPAGATSSSSSWRTYGRGLTGYYWYYQRSEQCTAKAPGSLKACGSRGSRYDGRYTYGDEGPCRSKIGCKCRETRQSGNANSGFTMVAQCAQRSFKVWRKCCDDAASACCEGIDCEVNCKSTSWW